MKSIKCWIGLHNERTTSYTSGSPQQVMRRVLRRFCVDCNRVLFMGFSIELEPNVWVSLDINGIYFDSLYKDDPNVQKVMEGLYGK